MGGGRSLGVTHTPRGVGLEDAVVFLDQVRKLPD